MAEAEGSGMKVAELTGPELDYWTGKAIGLDVELVDAVDGGKIAWANHTFYDPHEDWSQGGPLIHEKRIHIAQAPDCCWASVGIDAEHWIQGPDELTAACRAIVASVYGEETPEVET